MNAKKMIPVFFLCTLAISAPLLADPGTVPEPEQENSTAWQAKMEKRTQQLYEQLDLTPEQKNLLEENRSQHREKKKALFEKRQAMQKALQEALMKPDADMVQVQEIHDQLKAIQADMADERLNSMLEVRKILTEEQFKRFFSFMQEKGWGDHLKRQGEKKVSEGE